MISSSFKWDWQQTGAGESVTVEVRGGMRTARDLRSMLMNAAYSLVGRDDASVLCLLFNSGFSSKRLEQEKEQFHSIVKGEFARRVHVYALQSPSDLASLPLLSGPPADMEGLQAEVVGALAGKPRTSSQEAVVGTLLHRWIQGLPPVNVPDLASLSGASLPTVYAALKTIEPPALRRDEGRRLSLGSFSTEAWQKWLTVSTDRPSVRFVDRSGAPRSPERLLRQFAKLGRQDVAVGGVLGAKHHFAGLDMTAAPHLDLVVHGSLHADLSFVEQLDPGLARDDTKDGHGHVFVHFVNRPHSLFEKVGGVVWADVLECMVNMWEAQLIHQVESLIDHVAPGGLREAGG